MNSMLPAPNGPVPAAMDTLPPCELALGASPASKYRLPPTDDAADVLPALRYKSWPAPPDVVPTTTLIEPVLPVLRVSPVRITTAPEPPAPLDAPVCRVIPPLAER